MVRVEIKAELLRWARERAGLEREDLLRPFPKLDEWERGDLNPTLKQVENYARRTRVPVGYLFLPEPPEEQIPIPDFRTIGDRPLDRPSPNLLETIYTCQDRQEWYREHARRSGEVPLPFVGSATLQSDVEEVAAQMRYALDFDQDERAELRRWTDALRRFVEQADDLGILVMASGVVLTASRANEAPEQAEEDRGAQVARGAVPVHREAALVDEGREEPVVRAGPVAWVSPRVQDLQGTLGMADRGGLGLDDLSEEGFEGRDVVGLHGRSSPTSTRWPIAARGEVESRGRGGSTLRRSIEGYRDPLLIQRVDEVPA